MDARAEKLNELALRAKKCFRILPIGELTLNEISSLITIRNKCRSCDRLTMSEMGELLELCRSGASQLASRLERKGMLKRKVVLTDRRKTYVILTKKGQALVDNMESERIKGIECAVNILGEEKTDRFIELFEQYLEAIEGGNDVTAH